MKQQKNNGNSQLNNERDAQNERTEKKAFMGNTLKVKLDSKRRYRSI